MAINKDGHRIRFETLIAFRLEARLDYTYSPPLKPTFKRWRDIFRDYPKHSTLRVLEYEAIGKLNITGEVLDYGGGQSAQYLNLIQNADDIKSVNIDPDIDPTHLVQPGEPLPFPDNTFDFVVCFNTLEHIYDAYGSVQEMQRVLKPGGTAIVTVPFIFRIHGHPDDYSRCTPSWWRETCERTGYSELELQPLTWGRYTTAASILGQRGLFPRAQFHFQHFKDWVYAQIAFRGSHYDGRRGERLCNASPGWLLKMTK